MPYVPFASKFPNIGETETRSITIFNNPELPSDTYGLVEAYCDELDCDCRRVFLNIFSRKQERLLAVIAWGWENQKYYIKWMGDNDCASIQDLKGPALNLASPQSSLAPILLKYVKEILRDKDYVNRLKRHYQMFRDEVQKKKIKKEPYKKAAEKLGRNDPCYCGSGKKYKKCCIN